MFENGMSKVVELMLYVPCWSTKRPLTPPHCCIHSQMSIASGPSSFPNVFACTPAKSWFRVAEVGLLGSCTAFLASRKLLHPASPARPSPAAANIHLRIGFSSPQRLSPTVNTTERVSGKLK